MLKKLKSDMKDAVEKIRLNKKYTSEERLKEIRKIVFQEIQNKTFEQQETLLLLALEIGHPLKVKSNELKEDLEITLQIILIELIKCKEQQNKNANEQYLTLESLNDSSYTVIANKLRQLELEMSRHRILHFNTKLIEKRIGKQLELIKNINISFLQEKNEVEYVNNFVKNYKEKKVFKTFTFGLIFIYTGLLFRQKQWFNKINKIYRYGIFGIISAIFLMLR